MVKIFIGNFPHKIKNLREEKKLTQEELAGQLGISRQSIISVERGKCLPSLNLALRIAEIFNQSFDELFFDRKNNSNERGGENPMPRSLIPWSPFSDLDRFFDDEEIFPARGRFRALNVPPINVKQTEKEIIVTADIPGVKEEDINIEIGEDFVDISGERKEEKEQNEEGYYRKEVNYGSFSRRIPLPTEVLADKAEAKIKEGQLRLILPKVEPTKPKVTKIKVKKED